MNKEIRKRMEKMLRDEADNKPGWWYLTYADEKGWKGAILIRSLGFSTAVMTANVMGISPGGEVRGVPIPEDLTPDDKFTFRLLNKAEVEECWGEDVKSMAEWEKP